MKKFSILSVIIILCSLSSCIYILDYEIYVHVDYDWFQSGDSVYIDYTIYNSGDTPLENVIIEFGVDTEDNNDFNGVFDIQKWTTPVNIDSYGTYSADSFKIPLYLDKAYAVGILSIAMDNPPDDEEW